jgi:hypothetical protein
MGHLPESSEPDAMLLHALMPGMDPMRRGNEEQFLYARGFGQTVNILVHDARRTSTIMERLKAAKELGAPYHRRPMQHDLDVYVPKNVEIKRGGRLRQEIYVDTSDGKVNGFIVCDVDGSFPSTTCEYEFLHERLLLTVGFNKRFLDEWRTISHSVKDLMARLAQQAFMTERLNDVA